MATIYQQTANGLYRTGARTMTEFPSGLVRIDQGYFCATADAATHRATLALGATPPGVDTDPTIDGLTIYPIPQEKNRDDGFTDFAVSAFGRSRSTLSNIVKAQRLVALNPRAGAFSPLNYYLWEVTGSIVMPVDTVLTYDDLGLDTDLLDPFGFYLTNSDLTVLSATITDTLPGSPPVYQSVNTWQVEFTSDGTTVDATYIFKIRSPRISITSQRNFGDFVELDITTKPTSDLSSVV
jgi:hypothetical protein